MKKIVFIVFAFIVIFAGCATYQSEGLLNIEQQTLFNYKHAAISPETNNNVRGSLAQILKDKGFTVYQVTAFKNVVGIKPGNPLLVFECNDAGRTDRGLGAWSQSVECLAYDLHSEKIIYEGVGEYMGITVADDYRGATLEALKNLPSIGNQGIITSMVDLPYDKNLSPKTYKRRKDGSSSQGTAWVMSNGYIATNHHIIEGASEIKLIKTDGSELKAKIYKEDKVNDIALLEVISEEKLPPAIPISSKQAPVGQDVFTIGYPMAGILGTDPKFTSGKINSLSGIQNDPRVYQISVPVQAGNSGGPLLNINGEVVGIVTLKLHAVRVFKWTGDLPQNVNYAIKAQYITALLSDERKKDIEVLESKEGTFEELVERLKNSVFIIIAE